MSAGTSTSPRRKHAEGKPRVGSTAPSAQGAPSRDPSPSVAANGSDAAQDALQTVAAQSQLGVEPAWDGTDVCIAETGGQPAAYVPSVSVQRGDDGAAFAGARNPVESNRSQGIDGAFSGGLNMRHIRRRNGVDTAGRPPPKHIAVKERELPQASASEQQPMGETAGKVPPQPNAPSIDRISARSVRLRWHATDYDTNSGRLEYYLYRSNYRNTGERIPDSVFEIPCGEEESCVDPFGSKDQLAALYGYVLIACNEHGFSPPSHVTMVDPRVVHEIRRIYTEHCPTKGDQEVTTILSRHAGKEAELLKKVRAKYDDFN